VSFAHQPLPHGVCGPRGRLVAPSLRFVRCQQREVTPAPISRRAPRHLDTALFRLDVYAYVSQEQFVQAEPLAREAFEFNRKEQPGNWQRFRAESLLGASLAGQRKYAEAEPLLLEGYQGMLARKNLIGVPDWYHLDRAREWLVQLYQAWGKREKAADWQKK